MEKKKPSLRTVLELFDIESQIKENLIMSAESQGFDKEVIERSIDMNALMKHLEVKMDDFFTKTEITRLITALSGRIGKSLKKKVPLFLECINELVSDYAGERVNKYIEGQKGSSDEENDKSDAPDEDSDDEDGSGSKGGNGDMTKN